MPGGKVVTRISACNLASWRMVTPDADWLDGAFSAVYRTRMLDYSFTHWRDPSPLLQGYLPLTLARA